MFESNDKSHRSLTLTSSQFFEKFGNDPNMWIERRAAYTKSTAANSMVGMILGIGDRHSQNILIDEQTAEVIHIDFGITFEQGRALRTPEQVPFRLTPDVIDGFGITGVQGVFTRSCMETLSVLRANTEAILTICEVFVHDPLHRWTVSHRKQQRIENRNIAGDGNDDEQQDANHAATHAQQNPQHTPNLEADRVMGRLRQKLQGQADDGVQMDISAQVKRAIQEATDESNLSKMYFGWAPFL